MMPSSVGNTKQPDSKWTTTAPVAVVVLAFLASMVLVSVLIVTTSIAVFSGSTDSAGSSFSVGSVTLVDDDSAGSMFTVTNMTPGQAVSNCITVTYQGTIPDPSAVKVYSGGYTDSGDLDTYLNLTIEEGTGGGFGDCSGFSSENIIESGGTLSDFDSTHTNYATAAGMWDPASTPVSKTYRITVELDAATPNSEQNESVTAITLTWEVQS